MGVWKAPGESAPFARGIRGRDRAHSANFDIDTGKGKEKKSRCKGTAGGGGK